VGAAREEFSGRLFKGAVGALSWGSVGDKIARRRGEDCAAQLKKLHAALDAADAALLDAQRACAALDDAGRF
jgi:hypothetical protein